MAFTTNDASLNYEFDLSFEIDLVSFGNPDIRYLLQNFIASLDDVKGYRLVETKRFARKVKGGN